MDAPCQRQLTRWLVQLHAVEQQALFQLRRGRRLTPDAPLSTHIERHTAETQRHRRAVRERLSQLGRPTSAVLDIAVTLNRLGFLT